MSQEHDTPNGALNRRRFLRTMALGTAALAAGVLAACSATQPTAAPEATAAPDAPAAPEATMAPEATAAPATDAPAGEVAKIKALMWSNSPVLDENFSKRADLFNEKFKGKYEVDMQLLPWDQYWPKVDLAYASKDPIDVYFWDVQAYGHYKQGLLKNLQEDVNVAADLSNPELYPTNLFDVWRFDGASLFAIPENLQMMQMYYNKDLFDKAGVKYPDASWTWNDVLAAAAKLKISEGDTVTQWGFDIGDLGVWWGAQTLAWDQGGAFFDKIVEPTKFTVSEEKSVSGLKFIQDAMYVNKMAPDQATRSIVGQEVGIFASGKVAMTPGGSWGMSGYTDLKFKWDVAPLPKWTDMTVMPYWFGGWVVAKDGKQTDAATAWAIWCATEYQQTMAETRDWIPIRTDARNSAAFLGGLPAGFKTVLDTLPDAKLGDMYHKAGQQILGEVFGPILDQFWNNKVTAEEAGKQIDEKANALLAKG